MQNDHLDKITLMLVSGVKESAILEQAGKLGLSASKINKLIAAARKAITIAADYNRDEEVGTARLRLNDLYTRSLTIQDTKTALQCVRELNKLLSLYQSDKAIVEHSSNDGDGDMALARQHLEPLIDGGESLPLHELCRLAAGRIMGAKNDG